MTIQVTGILKDSSGEPSPNTPIQLLTVKGSDGVLPTAFYDTITDIDGNYDFKVNIGIHYLLVRYQNDYEKVGQITVNADTPSPLNLDSLLSFDEPLTPEQILQVQQLVAQAVEAADRAESAAESVEGIEQAVEEDRQEVADNAQQVADDKQTVALGVAQVEQDKNDVTSMTAQVTDARAEVEEDRQEVADNTATVVTLAPQVENNAQAVAEDTLETAASAELARRWSEGDTPSGDEPSDTNNAEYWAKLANEYTTRALAWGGVFTPTSGQEYPVPLTDDQDAQYSIKLTDGDDYYTFTTGELIGQIAYTGMTLIYDYTVPDTATWVLLRSGVGTVNSINGVVPDVIGNVIIKADDIDDVDSSAEVDIKLANLRSNLEGEIDKKADSAETYTKDDINNLIAISGAKNVLINTSFDGDTVINQRDFDGDWSALSVGDYGYDMWYKYSETQIAQIVEEGTYKKDTIHTICFDDSPVANITSPSSGHWEIVIPMIANYVDLYAGGITRDWQPEPISEIVSKCSRFYQKYMDVLFGNLAGGANNATYATSAWGGVASTLVYSAPMRAIPNVQFTETQRNSSYVGDISFTPKVNVLRVTTTGNTAYVADVYFRGNLVLDAVISPNDASQTDIVGI